MQVDRHKRMDELLVEELRNTSGDTTRVVAVLWTWLERNQIRLGSLRDKPPAIAEAALHSPRFEGLTDTTLEWVAEAPVRNGAELLARINLRFRDPPEFDIEFSRGVEDSEVIVAWRVSELVRRISRDGLPPAAREYPSPYALAPSLVVCPRTVNDVQLRVVEPDDSPWTETLRRLNLALVYEDSSSFCVHLDTLGDHGVPPPVAVEEERHAGRLDPSALKDEGRCVEAAKLAVSKAAGPASVLVMPELAATPQVVEAIRTQLQETDDAPLLSIVGLYHAIPDDEPEPDASEMAQYVNEAVVLGPDGTELWRHRKLTCASAHTKGAKKEEPESMVYEDIKVGEELVVVPTPLGALAVVICLDAIAEHARVRIAKSPANVLLVPSLSPTVFRHRASLHHLVQALWGVAFVCNRSFETGGWNDESSRSFWAIQRTPLVPPDEKEPSEHPSFIFELKKHERRKDDSEEEDDDG
jgi:predicted amidohydrolase